MTARSEYNHDSYGVNYEAGAWPLLSAERAIAGIEMGENVSEHYNFIARSASSAHMIPEQDTISVAPLMWSHASYLILKRSMRDRRSFYKTERTKTTSYQR
jgi:GH15 family glucan-1,4-alpha-glucosidase